MQHLTETVWIWGTRKQTTYTFRYVKVSSCLEGTGHLYGSDTASTGY
jgi:hypothetical protein